MLGGFIQAGHKTLSNLLLEKFRRSICSPPAFEESLEVSNSYCSPQMARPVYEPHFKLSYSLLSRQEYFL